MVNDQLIYGLRPILQAVQDGQTIDKVFLQKGISGALYTQLEGTLRMSASRKLICTVSAANVSDIRDQKRHAMMPILVKERFLPFAL